MSYGLSLNTGSYDAEVITPASYISTTTINCQFVDNVDTIYYVAYPAGWSRTNGFLRVDDESNQYLSMYALSFDDGNSRIKVTTRNGFAWGTQTAPTEYGTIKFIWFFRVVPAESGYGLYIKNGLDQSIISSKYPVYVVVEEGTMYYDSYQAATSFNSQWYHYNSYPQLREDDIVSIKLKPSERLARLRYGTIKHPNSKLIASASSVQYRVFRRADAVADISSGYGLKVYSSSGQLNYSSYFQVAPANGVFFDRDVAMTTNTLASGKDSWLVIEPTSQSPGGPLPIRDTYAISSYYVGRDSAGAHVFASTNFELNQNRGIIVGDFYASISVPYTIFQ